MLEIELQKKTEITIQKIQISLKIIRKKLKHKIQNLTLIKVIHTINLKITKKQSENFQMKLTSTLVMKRHIFIEVMQNLN